MNPAMLMPGVGKEMMNAETVTAPANASAELTLDTYQAKAWETAVYPRKSINFIYPTLGLCGEAGEVAEKVKKIIRDHGGRIPAEKHTEIVKELGDVLWYLAALSSELGVNLSAVAQANLDKLAKRAAENKLHGEGDNR